jgi:putative colanic acid biosynthesis glycosyltransferase
LKQNNIKISIVTVVYNGEKFLEKTIQSVVSQTYQNIEYIIIDGGSTDGTLDIIKRYEDSIDYWTSEADNGIYDAMNKGALVASGEFINYLNSDDTFLDENVLQNIVNGMDNLSKVYFARAKIQGNKESWLYPAQQYNKTNIDIWLKNALPNHQTMFFPKSFYKKVQYNLEYKIGSDSDYKFEAEKRCGFIFLDILVCKFELGGISSDFDNFKNVKQIIVDSWKISMKHQGFYYALKRLVKILAKFVLNKALNADLFSKLYKKIKQ